MRRDFRNSFSLGRGWSVHIKYEIELGQRFAVVFFHRHHEPGVEERIPSVVRFAGKVKLGDKNRLAGGLDLHVNMTRATRVQAWHDGLKAVSSLAIRKLMAPQPEPVEIVSPGIVGLPEIQQRAGYRFAPDRQHHTVKNDRLSLDPGLRQG